jgi:hypothetical protein
MFHHITLAFRPRSFDNQLRARCPRAIHCALLGCKPEVGVRAYDDPHEERILDTPATLNSSSALTNTTPKTTMHAALTVP